MRFLAIGNRLDIFRECKDAVVFYITNNNKKYAAVFLTSFNTDTQGIYIPEEYTSKFYGKTVENFVRDAFKNGCLTIDESEDRKSGYVLTSTIDMTDIVDLMFSGESNESIECYIKNLIIKVLGDKNKNESN